MLRNKVLTHAHALNPQDDDTANLLFKEALILAGREETHQNYDSALPFLQTAACFHPENQTVQQRLSELSRRQGPPPAPKRDGSNSPP